MKFTSATKDQPMRCEIEEGGEEVEDGRKRVEKRKCGRRVSEDEVRYPLKVERDLGERRWTTPHSSGVILERWGNVAVHSRSLALLLFNMLLTSAAYTPMVFALSIVFHRWLLRGTSACFAVTDPSTRSAVLCLVKLAPVNKTLAHLPPSPTTSPSRFEPHSSRSSRWRFVTSVAVRARRHALDAATATIGPRNARKRPGNSTKLSA